MARICRVAASGYPHHVTQRGVRSIPIFQTDSDRKTYLDFVGDELNRYGIEVLASEQFIETIERLMGRDLVTRTAGASA